jgi:crotonobetainyl-CoA:carnitine CoA-transferase CaiB-like acyl-CoA transferase
MIGRPDLIDDERYNNFLAQSIPERAEEFNAILLEWTLQHTKQECFFEGQRKENNVMCAPLNTPMDVVNDPHFRERGVWAKVNHPVMGEVEFPGRPFIMHECPWQMRFPAPLLGQHNEEVYGKLGYSKEDLVKLRENGVI